MRADSCAAWDGWTTGTPFWTPTPRSGAGHHHFSKQARLSLDGLDLTLLDTPGHVDFSVNGAHPPGWIVPFWLSAARAAFRAPPAAGWYHPFLFVNKMDLAGTDRAALLGGRRSASGGCDSLPRTEESAALCDDGILEKYLEEGNLDDGDVISLIRHRKVFPAGSVRR
ncbi:MAG: hypothetical protein ACLT5P_14220 [Flavonifractor plautii]